GGTIAVIGAGIGFLDDRFLTVVCLLATTVLILVLGLFVGVRNARTRYTNRVVVSPLAQALASILDSPEATTEAGINLDPRMTTIKQGPVGTVPLPPRFRANPQQRAEVEHLVSTRLPIDVDLTWHTRRNPQVLEILAAPKPPDMVPFSRYIAEMEACEQGQI